MIRVDLYPYQLAAINNLSNGKILCGGVGSGKSRTSLAYYYRYVLGGDFVSNNKGEWIEPKKRVDLYIITTARKRDTREWNMECFNFRLSVDHTLNVKDIHLTIDSWNNIKKYKNVKGAFFIFDEQRVIGSGSWVKSFLEISKNNGWILLSATPGDTWVDYIPVFVANGFYKNRTEFLNRHAVYNRYSKFSKIDRFTEESRLNRMKKHLLVEMDYSTPASRVIVDKIVPYDVDKYKTISAKRWDPYEQKPIKNVASMCYLLRRVVNENPEKLIVLWNIIKDKKKAIVFYNYNYERDMLRKFCDSRGIDYAEYNGDKHEDLPKSNSWIYIVQYTSGAEGWNCIDTDTIVFLSQNYSYKVMEQSAGRIDRLNTPYKYLHYYNLKTKSLIDKAIDHALKRKKAFNENAFYSTVYSRN